MSHTTHVSAVSSCLWSLSWPRQTGGVKSFPALRISPVSRCPAASGLRIGLQDPVLDLQMSAGVCTAPETTATIKRTSATRGRHLRQEGKSAERGARRSYGAAGDSPGCRRTGAAHDRWVQRCRRCWPCTSGAAGSVAVISGEQRGAISHDQDRVPRQLQLPEPGCCRT